MNLTWLLLAPCVVATQHLMAPVAYSMYRIDYIREILLSDNIRTGIPVYVDDARKITEAYMVQVPSLLQKQKSVINTINTLNTLTSLTQKDQLHLESAKKARLVITGKLRRIRMAEKTYYLGLIVQGICECFISLQNGHASAGLAELVNNAVPPKLDVQSKQSTLYDTFNVILLAFQTTSKIFPEMYPIIELYMGPSGLDVHTYSALTLSQPISLVHAESGIVDIIHIITADDAVYHIYFVIMGNSQIIVRDLARNTWTMYDGSNDNFKQTPIVFDEYISGKDNIYTIGYVKASHIQLLFNISKDQAPDQAPPDNGTDQAPDNGIDQAPPDNGTNQAPPDNGTDQAPPDQAPPDNGTDQAPPDNGTDQAPPDNGTDQAPPDQAPPDQAPPDNGTDQAPPNQAPDNSTDQAPPNQAPPDQATPDNGTDKAPDNGTDKAARNRYINDVDIVLISVSALLIIMFIVFISSAI